MPIFIQNSACELIERDMTLEDFLISSCKFSEILTIPKIYVPYMFYIHSVYLQLNNLNRYYQNNTMNSVTCPNKFTAHRIVLYYF